MTKTHLFLGAAILAGLAQATQANPVPRSATITGAGGSGRCTIEVTVDGAAEVEISVDRGLLTTISGQQAQWRRFQCNQPLPFNPVDFSLVRTDGNRGSMRLVQDPRGAGGRAVIRINDPKGGRAGYIFDLRWGGYRGGGGWTPGPPSQPPPGPPPNGPWPGPGGSPIARAIRVCQEAVTDRLDEDGYRAINFDRIFPDDNPGRRDWVIGNVSGKRGFGTAWFSFSCSVDFSSGRVRSVDVRRR